MSRIKHLLSFHLLTLLFILSTPSVFSQQIQDLESKSIDEYYEISILTCGTGADLYAAFGHSAIRVKEHSSGMDRVYNYGVFNFNDPNFYSKFTLGSLDYYLDTTSFENFIYEYEVTERKVIEQKLNLPQAEIHDIFTFLENNALPENKYYRYDFTEDNCATKIRDVFTNTLDINFLWGDILNNKTSTYRHAINLELPYSHWTRFGINIILGSKVDEPINDDQIMFLPKYLSHAFINASYRLEPLVKNTEIIQPKETLLNKGFNGPLWMNIGILILVALSFHTRIFGYLKPTIRFIVLFATGILGLFILFMWLGTEHIQTKNNYNILWAVPTNIIIAFLAHKKKAWIKMVALANISLLMVAFIIHLLGMQILPLIELSPLFLALIYIYLDLYKSNINTTNPHQV